MKLLETEFTLEISKVVMWTRISEIQELSTRCTWRYVDYHSNPAYDLTRGRTLEELSIPNKWSQVPSFLLRPEPEWPAAPLLKVPMNKDEQRMGIFCGIVIEVAAQNIPEPGVS